MLGKRELVRVRRGRVVVSQWVPVVTPEEVSASSQEAQNDIERERERVNARYRQLGGTGPDPVSRDAGNTSGKSLGELVVSGDASRAQKLKERTIPKTLRYQARGRVRLRLR